MGFAVVAGEVRELAQRCGQAARDTTVLIQESIDRSREGRRKLDEVVSSIRSITDGSVQVKALSEGVSHGSQEQAQSADLIARALRDLETGTQSSAAAAQENAAAGEQLQAQSESLRSLVERLGVLVGQCA